MCHCDVTDAIQAAQELLMKKRQQMTTLREERARLNDRLANPQVRPPTP